MNHLKSAFARSATICLLLAGTTGFSANAQNARETSIKFMKDQQNAIVADFNMPADVVKDALKDRLEKAGLTNRGSTKGFTSYKGTMWAEIATDKLDVYTNVEGKKDQCTITIMVSKGYDNFVSSTTDAPTVEKIKTFLNNFTTEAKNYQLRLGVMAQEEMVKKAEKNYNDKVSDGARLAQDQAKLTKEMADNRDDQAKKQVQLEAEKTKLADMKRQLPG